MRFLKLFIGIVLVLILLPIPFVGGYVELSTWWGAWRVKQEVRQLMNLAQNPLDKHKKVCRKAVEMASRENLVKGKEKNISYQLRFTSSQDYVTEMLCEGVRNYAEVVKQGKLSLKLAKIEGTGVRTGESNSGIAIKQFYRTLYIYLHKNNLSLTYTAPDFNWQDNGPITSCQGWGGLCCQDNGGVGMGEEYQVADCSNNCFKQCGLRPAIAYFYPILDTESKDGEILVNSGEVLEFEYEAADADGVIEKLTIDFGDGQTYEAKIVKESTDEKQRPRRIINGTTVHTYQCLESDCIYEAKISAIDNDGLSLAENEFNWLRVEVRGQ